MKVYVGGSSFNKEDQVFTTALANHFNGRTYGMGLTAIVLWMEVVDVSDYSGNIAQPPVFANGKINLSANITISGYYDTVSPAEYRSSVMQGLEMLEYTLPKGIDFNTSQFLDEAKKFITEYG